MLGGIPTESFLEIIGLALGGFLFWDVVTTLLPRRYFPAADRTWFSVTLLFPPLYLKVTRMIALSMAVALIVGRSYLALNDNVIAMLLLALVVVVQMMDWEAWLKKQPSPDQLSVRLFNIVFRVSVVLFFIYLAAYMHCFPDGATAFC